MAQTESPLDTEKDAELERTAPAPVRPYLFLVLECCRPAAGGSRYALDGVDTVRIGRGDRLECAYPDGDRRTLTIKIPSRFASNRHADLKSSGLSWVLTDCGSTNGTFVNGERITSRELHDGDLIEIGRCLFILGLAIATPSGLGDCRYVSSETDSGPFATLLPTLHAGLQRLRAAATTPLTILLVGATGTGKEVMARAVHALSGRTGEMVAVNCAALPPALAESLLFGHTKGSFSGAVRDEPGLLRAAHRGTLFLDEIADLGPHVQPMLLRAVQDGEVYSVGSSRPTKVDLRIIAASQTPLSDLVSNNSFRRDLHARLNGFELRLPSLAERRVDLGIVLGALLGRMGSVPVQFSREAANCLCTYSWPQNIRELEQAIRHAFAFRTGPTIMLDDLPIAIARAEAGSGPGQRETCAPNELAPQEVERCLADNRGSIEKTWRALGLKNRFALLRLIKKYALTRKPHDRGEDEAT